MAERTVLVCDVCGAPAAMTVTLRVDGKTLHKDLCSDHVNELTQGARAARPGRRRSPGPAAAAKTSGPRARGGAKAKATRTDRGRPRRARSAAKASEGTTRPADGSQVAAEVRKLREEGLTYRQIGEALVGRGITPPRAKAWNPVVIGRMLKRSAAA